MGWEKGDYDEMLDEINKIADGLGFSMYTNESNYGGEVEGVKRVELMALAFSLWKVRNGF
jgi:hypothetical protein